jgi:hypothetical protein
MYMAVIKVLRLSKACIRIPGVLHHEVIVCPINLNDTVLIALMLQI